DIDRCALARAVHAEKGEQAPPPHRKGDAAERLYVTVPLFQPLYRYDLLLHTPPAPPFAERAKAAFLFFLFHYTLRRQGLASECAKRYAPENRRTAKAAGAKSARRSVSVIPRPLFRACTPPHNKRD